MRWREEVRVTRGTFAAISFAVGLVLAGALWLGWTAADDAGDARNDIRASVSRLDRIENPSAEQIRAFLDRLVRDATPEQRRALERAIKRREIVLRREASGGPSEPSVTPRQRRDRRRPDDQPDAPPASEPSTPTARVTPSAPSSSSPSRSNAPGPVVHVDPPAVDIDGPRGIAPDVLPKINIPPVGLPPIRVP
jgi:hypothetical protein